MLIAIAVLLGVIVSLTGTSVFLIERHYEHKERLAKIKKSNNRDLINQISKGF